MNFTLTGVSRRGAALGVCRLMVGFAVALAVSPVAVIAQSANTGTVEGRVQSATTGTYLNNARVRVTGTTREVFTNSFGEYRLQEVPAGTANLEVLFTGMATQSIAVTVPAGGAV